MVERSIPASTVDRDAGLAVESGRRAFAERRWGAGQIFMVNAITKAPRNLDHLKAYTNSLLAQREAPEAALDHLAGILQMAACHVAPDDISTVITLIDRVADAQDKAHASPSDDPVPPEQSAGDSLDAEWQRLVAVPLDVYKDSVSLANHLRALENHANNLDERGNATPEQTKAIAEQIRRWSEIAQAATNAAYVDQCLARLTDEEIKTTDTDRVVAVVQAAEAVLPSFWGITPKTLPDELSRRIDAFPSAIKGRVERISLKKSDDLFRRIAEKLPDAEIKKPLPGPNFGVLEALAKKLEEQIKQAQVLAAQLPSPDRILEAQKRIESYTKQLQDCRSEQYNRYQIEVTARSRAVFDKFMDRYFNPSEDEAMDMIRSGKLASVDQARLSPEVARLYNDVLGRLMGRFNPKKLVEAEGLLTDTLKLKLEDF